MNCTVSSPKLLRVLWFLKLLYYRENFPEFQVRVKIDAIFTECTYLGLTLQICIRQVLDSYLGQDIEYPDRFLEVFLSSLVSTSRVHDGFLQTSFHPSDHRKTCVEDVENNLQKSVALVAFPCRDFCDTFFREKSYSTNAYVGSW